MQTLRQTLKIPESHKLHLDIVLPNDFPTGLTDVLLVFASQKTPTATDFTDTEELFNLAGSLKNSPNFLGDPVKIQKAIRDEWER